MNINDKRDLCNKARNFFAFEFGNNSNCMMRKSKMHRFQITEKLTAKVDTKHSCTFFI